MVREWWVARRNALLSSAGFQRRATRFWVSRPIARRHARRLFDLVAGFTYSQTLFACVQIDLFTRLASGPATIADIAAAADLPAPAAERLVRAAEAIALVERLRDGRVTLGVAGAALAGNPGVLAMIRHHVHLYADLADPVALLRRGGGGGALDRFWAYARTSGPDAVADYSVLMAASHQPVAEQVLDAYDVSRHRRLLDIGGGEGAFLQAVRRRAPALALGLLDLPAVAARARARLGAQVSFFGGDFLADPVPSGFDCITLIRVLHDHDDAAALTLLRAIRAAMLPDGRLLIGEPMAGAAGAEPVGATYFGLYLLAMGSGRARSPAEIGALLTAAGFTRWRRIATAMPLTAGVIVARL